MVRKIIEFFFVCINFNGILGGDDFFDEGIWGVVSVV